MRLHSLFLAIGLLLAHTAQAQLHGSLEFEEDGTFTPPKGVKSVTVEMWGAGGSGGGAGASFGGGGGGAGGYVRGIVGIKGKRTFNITVGRVLNPALRDSIFADSLDNPLLTATGGSNGTSGASGGAGGAGGTGLPATMLVRTGATGDPGIAGSTGTGGTGGVAVRGSIEIKAGAAAGGHGGSTGQLILSGGPGHVILSW